jgi:hypothetical protein
LFDYNTRSYTPRLLIKSKTIKIGICMWNFFADKDTSWFVPLDLFGELEEDVEEQVDAAIKKNSSEPKTKEVHSNQGRERCYKCGTKTVKVDTGMFSVYDICPKCRI